MEIFSGLMQGFAVALQPVNLLWCLLGVVLGTVVGVMPGLAPSGTIAMLLPLTFAMNPAAAMIMLAGIYYGAKYGGSTTAILLNVPGESASVVTCLDGHQMARNGRAGPALGIAAIASFIAGTVGVLGLMLVAPPLARMALAFSSPEYFALMSLGLAMVVLLAGRCASLRPWRWRAPRRSMCCSGSRWAFHCPPACWASRSPWRFFPA